MRVHGYIAPLAEQGPRRGPQNIYVNGRIVRDKTIAHAIQAAYAVATVKERSPEVHLFIEMPPERVDVNVHPTKAEVRFLEQGLVHEVLRRALSDALGQGPGTASRRWTIAPPCLAPACSGRTRRPAGRRAGRLRGDLVRAPTRRPRRRPGRGYWAHPGSAAGPSLRRVRPRQHRHGRQRDRRDRRLQAQFR